MSASLELSDSLQEVVYGNERPSADELPALRARWVREAAERYVAGSPHYQRVAAAAGFSPELVVAEADLGAVPVLPVRLFKRQDVSIVAPDTRNYRCQSSGTQGERSEVWRDESTMEAFAASLLHAAVHLLGLSGRAVVHALSPPPDESVTWFAQIVELMSLPYETWFHVHDGVLDWRAVIDGLQRPVDDRQMIVVGAPFYVQELAEKIRRERIEISLEDGLVLTGGGWKTTGLAATLTRSELGDLISATLGLGPDRLRDMFNMVELNSVLMDCELGAKHAPPWLTVHARQPRDMRPLVDGEAGMLSFLDPTATSYPAFVLSDDLGTVRSSCPCGRPGLTVEYVRRLDLTPSRGCASQLAEERVGLAPPPIGGPRG